MVKLGETNLYTVYVHLIEARGLTLPGKSLSADPFARVTFNNQIRETIIQRNTVNITWGERICFDRVELTAEEFETENVYIELFDANTLWRNELIGSHTFGVAKVHGKKNPNHQIFNTWVVLVNPANPNICAGYLNVTITVLGSFDIIPISLEEEKDTDGRPDVEVIGLPNVERHRYQLNVKVYRAEYLPIMDYGYQACDPFVVVRFNGDVLRTSHIKRNCNPEWNQQMIMSVYTPCMTDNISIQIWDYCKMNPDEFIGKFNLKFSSLLGDTFGPVWVNIYGTPIDESGFWGWMGEVFRPLITDEEYEATAFLGRILIGVAADSCFDNTMNEVKVIQAIREPLVTQYALSIDLYEGFDLPIGSSDLVCVEVTFGPHQNTLRSDWCNLTKDSTGRMTVLFSCGRDDRSSSDNGLPTAKGKCQFRTIIEQLPKIDKDSQKKFKDQLYLIIVNVYVKTSTSITRIGYLKYEPLDFFNPDSKVAVPKWHKLIGVAKPNGTRENVGYVLMSFEFKEVLKKVTYRRAMKSYIPELYTVKCHIYQCRNLHMRNNAGYPNPYVKVTLPGFRFEKKEVDNKLSLIRSVDRKGSAKNTVFHVGEKVEVYCGEKSLEELEKPNTIIDMNDYKIGKITHVYISDDKKATYDVIMDDFYVSTKTKQGTSFPAWYETVELKNVALPKPSELTYAPDIIVTVYDQVVDPDVGPNGDIPVTPHNQKRSNNDLFRGSCSVPLANHLYKPNSSTTPGEDNSVSPHKEATWIPLSFNGNIVRDLKDQDCTILVAFEVIENKVLSDYKTAVMMKDKTYPWGQLLDYEVTLGLVGIRDLIGLGNRIPSSYCIIMDVPVVDIIQDVVEEKKGEDSPRLDLEDDQGDQGDDQGSEDQGEGDLNSDEENFDGRVEDLNTVALDTFNDPTASDKLALGEEIISNGEKEKLKVTITEKDQGAEETGQTGGSEVKFNRVIFGQYCEGIIKLGYRKPKGLKFSMTLTIKVYEFSDSSKGSDQEKLKKLGQLIGCASIDLKLQDEAKDEDDENIVQGKANKQIFQKNTVEQNRLDPYKNAIYKSSQQLKEFLDDEEALVEEGNKGEMLWSAVGGNTMAPVLGSRQVLSVPLEKSPLLKLPYKNWKLVLGNSRATWFGAALALSDLPPKQTATLKLTVEVSKKPSIITSSNISVVSKLIRDMKEKRNRSEIEFVKVRVYLLSGHDLAPKRGGKSDPYVSLRTITAGVANPDGFISYINDSKSSLSNTLNPKFNMYYELDAVFPGSTKLEISINDAGFLGFDSIIGFTQIDLEDRWLHEEWKQAVIRGEFVTETRPLWNTKQTKISQGQIQLWVEMYQAVAAGNIPRSLLEPIMINEFELRVVIWKTKRVPCISGNTVSIMVRGEFQTVDGGGKAQAYFPVDTIQDTDVEFQSKDGNGTFNWRMKFVTMIPCNSPRLKLQLMDEGTLGYSFISEAFVDLTSMFNRAMTSKQNQGVPDKRYTVPCTHPKFIGNRGSIEIGITLVTKTHVERYPVGLARNEPNRDPYLPHVVRKSRWGSLFGSGGGGLGWKVVLIFSYYY